MLTRTEIFMASNGYRDYSSASDYVRNKRVFLNKNEEKDNLIYVSGTVVDPDKTYHAEVSVNMPSQGEYFIIIGRKCTCSGSIRSLCIHQTALMLEWIEHIDNQEYFLQTSPNFSKMVRSYQYRLESDDNLTYPDAKLMIHPCVKIYMNEVYAGLKAGFGKTYVIKRLTDFIYSIDRHAAYTFGSKDPVGLSPDNISENDKPLFDLLSRKSEAPDYGELSGQAMYRYYKLSHTECDEFINICRSRTISVDSALGKAETFIVDEDPKFNFLVKRASKRGIYIRPQEKYEIFNGKRNSYIYMNSMIYSCSENFSKNCSIFLTGFNRNSIENEEVYVLNNDAANFSRYVLSQLDDFISFRGDTDDLEKLKPQKFEASFYFDMPDGEVLTCDVKLQYGQELIGLTDKESSVIRNTAKEKEVENLIAKYFIYLPEDKIFVANEDDDKIFELLDNNFSEFFSMGKVYVSDSLKSLHIRTTPKVTVGVSIRGDLLDLKIDAEGMTGSELEDMLSKYREKRRFFRLKSGDIIKLSGSDDTLDSVEELTRGLRLKKKSLEDSISLPKNRALYIDKVMGEKEGTQIYSDNEYKKIIRSLAPGRKNDHPVPSGINAELRPYQIEGFDWLSTLFEYGFGGILADDMGLGKTLQIITLILSQKKDGRTSLVCCPASLVYNWYSEFERFAPDIKCQILQGEQSEREQIINNCSNWDVLITSYDILRRDLELYKNTSFFIHVIDEAQFIKNQNTQKSHAVKEITSAVRFALTGTPIENKLSELWSIFDFLMPGYLYSYQMFKAVIEAPVVKEHDKEALDRIHKLISPFILRRLKKDVLKELPDKMEEVVYARLEGEQKKLYTAHATRLLGQLSETSDSSFNKGKIEILSQLTRLRQICCDPSLVYDNYSDGSAKLNACIELVQMGIDGGHKILIFSQFTSMLKIIQTELAKREISFYKLTGETPSKERLDMVNQFQNDDTPVFLISLKAGGTGLNLTAADIVIHFDPWWNVAAQNQATDRSHRIGQANTVNVYKIIAKDTIEDKIMELQNAKKQLADDILSGEHTSISSLDKQELMELLG